MDDFLEKQKLQKPIIEVTENLNNQWLEKKNSIYYQKSNSLKSTRIRHFIGAKNVLKIIPGLLKLFQATIKEEKLSNWFLKLTRYQFQNSTMIVYTQKNYSPKLSIISRQKTHLDKVLADRIQYTLWECYLLMRISKTVAQSIW